MAAIAPILVSKDIPRANVLTNAFSATVATGTTLSPVGLQNNQPGIPRWVDKSGGILIGYPAFTLSVRAPSPASRITRVQAKLTQPVMEAVVPPSLVGPLVAYVNTVNAEFLIHERSTLADRLQLLSMFRSLLFETINASDAVPSDLTGTPLTGAILDGESPW